MFNVTADDILLFFYDTLLSHSVLNCQRSKFMLIQYKTLSTFIVLPKAVPNIGKQQ